MQTNAGIDFKQRRKKMREKFFEDINRRLIMCEKLGQEEELIIFDGLVKKYKKILKEQGEGNNELLLKVIKSLPKYSKYFENSDFNKCLKDYKESLPTEVTLDENNVMESIGNLIDRAIFMQAELGKFSKNSGINVINDKTNYTNNIADFEFASEKFTPEFIKESISKMGNDSPEMVELYTKKYEYLCKNLAESAINDKIDYYTRTVDYLVDFYSDNEIARKEEKTLA